MARSDQPARKVWVDPKTGTTHDLEETLHDMRQDFIQCRDFGHAWRPFTARWMPAERVYHTQLRCSRCRTIRTRYINDHGQQVGHTYAYPDGYQIRGMGRMTGEDRDHLRLESVLRVVEIDEKEA